MVAITEEASAGTPHDPIYIVGDDFSEENGVIDGNGTPEDPYIIEGWEVEGSGIVIRDTEASFVLRNLEITTSYGSTGISVLNASGFSIYECTVAGVGNGMEISSSENFTVEDNLISCGSATALGSNTMLWMVNSGEFEVRDNTLTNQGLFGARNCVDLLFADNDVSDSSLALWDCRDCTITDNSLAWGINLQGDSLEYLNTHEMMGNTAGGYSILYVVDRDAKLVANANLGQVIAVNCTNTTISHVNFKNAAGPCVYYSDMVSIEDCELVGQAGTVVTAYCNEVDIVRCLIREALYGIRVTDVESVEISGCLFDDCGVCVLLDTEDVIIRTNHLRDSSVAVAVLSVDTAEIFGNNFVELASPLEFYMPGYVFDEITWNADYETGGNYWDDYDGTDVLSGPDQDEPGSDGIGDTPFSAEDGEVVDEYPLMAPVSAQFGPEKVEEETEDSSGAISLAIVSAAVVAVVLIVALAIYAMSRRKRVIRPPFQ